MFVKSPKCSKMLQRSWDGHIMANTKSTYPPSFSFPKFQNILWPSNPAQNKYNIFSLQTLQLLLCHENGLNHIQWQCCGCYFIWSLQLFHCFAPYCNITGIHLSLVISGLPRTAQLMFVQKTPFADLHPPF